MSQWVGVHGIGQQYLGPSQILEQWVPALADGLEWATGQRYRPDLDLAFYGTLFRQADPETGDPGRGKGPQARDAEEEAEEILADLDEAELADLTAATEQIVTHDDLAAAASSPAKGTRLPVPVRILIGAIERRFPVASGVLFLGDLRQVRKYLRDSRLKRDVDDVIARKAVGATVLIGHSLGSVVAHEYLRQHPGHSVRLLLTLGSPLGLRMVRDRLPAGEIEVMRWVNVRDPHDPVTAAGALRRWYPAAVDRLADNGAGAHDAAKYLSHKATGEALRDFLPVTGL